MHKVNKAFLEAKVRRLNLKINPHLLPNKIKYNTVGAFLLSCENGGYSLHRVTSSNGCVDDILRIGHTSKKELAKQMHAFERGYDFFKDQLATSIQLLKTEQPTI